MSLHQVLGVRLYFEEKAQGKAVGVGSAPAQLGMLSSLQKGIVTWAWSGSVCLPKTGISNSCCGHIRFRGAKRMGFVGARVEGVS